VASFSDRCHIGRVFISIDHLLRQIRLVKSEFSSLKKQTCGASFQDRTKMQNDVNVAPHYGKSAASSMSPMIQTLVRVMLQIK
jgi:hypothetical protein